MTKKFYAEAQGAGGTNYLNAYGTPTTIRFDLSRELEIADRIRPIDEAAVVNMMLSLGREGQLKPILIRVWVSGRKHARVPRLVCGAHRVEAARRLGWTHLAAWFVECDDDEARQAEVDENLIRKGLPPEVEGQLMIEWCRLHGLPLPGEDESDADIEAAGAAVVDTDKVVNVDHFIQEPTSSPVATTPRPRTGRGNKGTVSKAAEAFGVSKNTARSRLTAGQDKPAKRRPVAKRAAEFDQGDLVRLQGDLEQFKQVWGHTCVTVRRALAEWLGEHLSDEEQTEFLAHFEQGRSKRHPLAVDDTTPAQAIMEAAAA
jgi:hypothetical protein